MEYFSRWIYKCDDGFTNKSLFRFVSEEILKIFLWTTTFVLRKMNHQKTEVVQKVFVYSVHVQPKVLIGGSRREIQIHRKLGYVMGAGNRWFLYFTYCVPNLMLTIRILEIIRVRLEEFTEDHYATRKKFLSFGDYVDSWEKNQKYAIFIYY